MRLMIVELQGAFGPLFSLLMSIGGFKGVSP